MNKNMLLREITNTRLLLHDYIYNKMDLMQDLIQELDNSFNLFSIDYDINKKIIQFKIKKTNMKKINGNIQNYYYPIINDIFVNFFHKNHDIIHNIIKMEREKYNLSGLELSLLLDPITISGFYNIILISDNIIMLYL